MVQIKTFYKDIGYARGDVVGDIFGIFITIIEGATAWDIASIPLIHEMIKIGADCEFSLFQDGGVFRNYLCGFVRRDTFLNTRPINTAPQIVPDPLLFTQAGSGGVLEVHNVMVLSSETSGLYMDIYSVCTSKEYRSVGPQKEIRKFTYLDQHSGAEVKASISQLLFTFAIDVMLVENPEKTISLGVLFTNPYFDAAVKLYTRAGFANPKFSKNLNIRQAPVPILKLETNEIIRKTSITPERSDDNFRRAYALKKKFNENYRDLVIQIVISKQFNDHITSLLTLSTETGAGLFLAKLDGQTYQLVYPCILERITHPAPGVGNYLAYPPNTAIQLHTHPAVCRGAYDCTGMWPSGIDSINTVTNSLSKAVAGYPYLQIIATLEGYYTQQVTDYFFNIMRTGFTVVTHGIFSPRFKYAKFIVNFMYIYVSYLEIERMNGLVHAGTRNEYLVAMNNLSIKSLTDNYFGMIGRLLNLYASNRRIYDLMIGNIKIYSAIELPGFENSALYTPSGPLDIINLLLLAKHDRGQEIYDFLLLSHQKGRAEFIDPIIEECRVNNVNILEPFYITTLVDDFVINPGVDSASFTYYNYDKYNPNSVNVMSLQESSTPDQVIKELANDTYIVANPPPLGRALDKLKGFTGYDYTGNCDPSFYYDPAKITTAQFIK
jgi:hypothetical protein